MESVNIHTGHLNHESYELIAGVCQFCELSVARINQKSRQGRQIWKPGSHERIRNRCEFPGFLVSRFVERFFAADTAASTCLYLCELGAISSPRNNLRQSADKKQMPDRASLAIRH